MFADRETLEEAYNFADTIIRGSESPVHVATAIQVVVNTIAKEIGELEQMELQDKNTGKLYRALIIEEVPNAV
jgi:hypothetical protein